MLLARHPELKTLNETNLTDINSLIDTVNKQSIIIQHLIKYQLHITSGNSAMKYINTHPDSEFGTLLQSAYSISSSKAEAPDFTSQIESSTEETEKMLKEMKFETFQTVLDSCVNYPPSPLELFITKMSAEHKLSDMKIDYVRERTPVSSAVAEVSMRKKFFGGIDEIYTDKLLKWTNKKKASVLFDSDQVGRSAAQFNEAVCGKHDIAIFVINGNNDIFGSYHQKEVKAAPKSRWEAVTDDPGFFVFTARNSCGVEMSKYNLHSNGNSLLIFPNREGSYVFGIESCYFICQIESSVMSKSKFKKNYVNVPDCSVDLFAGVGKEKFIAQKIVVLQLN